MSGTIGNIGGSGGSSSSQSDSEFLILCDIVGSTVTKFLRKYVTNSVGVTSTVDTYLDGVTTYNVSGNVAECLDAGFSVVLCDVTIPQCEVGNLVVDSNWLLTGNVTQFFASDFEFNVANSVVDGVVEQVISGLNPLSTYQFDFVADQNVTGPHTGVAQVFIEIYDDASNLVYSNLVDATTAPAISVPGLTNSTSFHVIYTDSTTDTTNINLLVLNSSLTCTAASTTVINKQFLRSFCKDCTSSIFKDTELDGTTVYTPTGTVKICQELTQYQLISECYIATLAELGQISVGDIILRLTNVDVKTNPFSVISTRYLNQNTGLFITGTPSLNTLKPCALESFTESFVCASGTTLIKRTNSLTNYSEFLSTDGVIVPTPITYTNGSCTSGEEDFFLQILCDDNGQFIRKFVRDSNGVIVASDVTLNGVSVYTVAGTVKECSPKNIFGTTLCDTSNGTVTQFLRRYEIDSVGTLTTKDTELDGITLYLPQGTVSLCNPATKLCLTCRG